ncbi:MAG: recombinase family protein, partial [Armatimonadetes bacterium]|nr:recombinase family protein [Armatimonadota bacterium]
MSHTETLLQRIVGQSGLDQARPERRQRKALAWGRVSTAGQDERGRSIPEQLREIAEYAEKHDIEIVDTFQEAASAFKHDERRLEFHKMIQMAKSRPDVTTILVHDLSRFSRDSVKGRQLYHELREQGLEIISLNDPEMDSDSVSGVY